MNQKAGKILGFTVLTILLLSITSWFAWCPILSSCAVRSSTKYFREQFQPNQDMYICIHEDTWAWYYFAGTKGLPTLAELSQDTSLAPCGQSLASNLYHHISSGKHLQVFDEMTKHTAWYAKQYMKYLRKRDRKYLSKKES